MSLNVKETCELCGEVIKKGEKTLRLTTGISRSKGFIRDYFSIFNKRYALGKGFIHIECLSLSKNYDYQNPQLIIDHILRGAEK